MGLDVYLHRYTMERALVAADEAAVEAVKAAAWGGRNYNDLTEAERSEAIAKGLAAEAAHNMVDGSHLGLEKIETASAKHPGHTFKIGYMRSSYNDSGINQYLKRQGVPDLYAIFGLQRGECGGAPITPDWQASRDRADRAIETLRAKADGLDLFEAPSPIRPLPGDPAAILNAVRDRLANAADYDYIDSSGTYFPKGETVVAIVNGERGRGLRGSGVYVVTKSDPVDNWYLQALEIVVEMIDYVLAQPDRDAFSMYWSG